MTNEELQHRAADLGLQRLAKDFPADLEKALENGNALKARLPSDLPWTLEPAHTFSLATARNPHSENRS
jgi:hypothetical protein